MRQAQKLRTDGDGSDGVRVNEHHLVADGFHDATASTRHDLEGDRLQAVEDRQPLGRRASNQSCESDDIREADAFLAPSKIGTARDSGHKQPPAPSMEDHTLEELDRRIEVFKVNLVTVLPPLVEPPGGALGERRYGEVAGTCDSKHLVARELLVAKEPGYSGQHADVVIR